MKYFDIPTVKGAIEGLQDINANWLLPAFVFAANNVGTDTLVDMSKGLGTDQFLDRYFNGRRVGLPPFNSGRNLLRPRLKGITWDRGVFAGDYIVRQDTKMWGNLFSSRGYREMRLEGLIEGEKAITKLTDAFQPRFENEIPPDFKFENFLIWLFAFEGVPDDVNSWEKLYAHLLKDLGLAEFKSPYRQRFRLSDEHVPWPQLVEARPSDTDFMAQLAPRLVAFLANPSPTPAEQEPAVSVNLPIDDPILAVVSSAIEAEESLAFLLAGPPGTGKTHYARLVADALTGKDPSKSLFLQFHPAIGYDDFMEGFRPVQTPDGSGIRYELASRLFLGFAAKAAADPTSKYVMVIDEINRGDVARIFGEALTYLEVDYRKTEFILPFSGRPASVPKNLIVLATANPYDRSVTDLDDALLRRFWVIEMEPDETFLRNHLNVLGVAEGITNRTVQVFNILNRSFPHGFGHTSFLKVRTVDDLARVWIGRVKLALRRAYMHDRSTFDSIAAEVEALLRVKDDAADVDTAQGNPT